MTAVVSSAADGDPQPRSARYRHDRGGCHPGRRAGRLGAAVLDLPPAARQVAADFLQPGLDRRLRLGLLLAEHAAARRAADPDRSRLRHPGPHRPDHDRRRKGRWCWAASRQPRSPFRWSTGGWPAIIVLPLMALAAMIVGGLWIGLAGWLRHYRGVNETISSLLLSYIAIAIMNFFVEGALRDPASANKPSTMPIGDAYRVGTIPGPRCHWGLAAGIMLAVALYILMSAHHLRLRRPHDRRQCPRRAGAGPAGRYADRLLLRHTPGPAPASPASSRSRRSTARPTPRSSPATASPASSSPSWRGRTRSPSCRSPSCSARWPRRAASIQRRMGMPDATVLVLQGIIFVVLLVSETFYGRFTLPAASQHGRPDMNGADLVTVLIAMLGGAIRVSTPFMFVALGECLTEKSGRINLGLEGNLVLGAMVAYAVSYQTGSPGSACCGRPRRPRARRHARLHLQAAQGQRHRRRHRHHELRHRPRLLLRQALHPADRAAPRRDPARRLDRAIRQLAQALEVNPLFFVGIALAVVPVVGLPQHALGPDRPHDRRQRRLGHAPWASRSTWCASWRRPRAASWPASAAPSCRSTIPAAGTRAFPPGRA